MGKSSIWARRELLGGKILRELCFSSAILAAAAGLVSCQSGPGPTAAVSTEASPVSSPTAEATGSGNPTAVTPVITLWLPPVFRPDLNSPGGKILQDRIDAYKALHPGVMLSIRIKDSTGSGGMRDSLAAAAAAAPDALPDLVALDQSNLRAAAIKGLVYPLDGFLPAANWDDGYPYARSMAGIGASRYGFFFAGDAMVFADTLPANLEPETWDQTLSRVGPVFFPLGDSRSLFLFFGYYAAGGTPLHSLADAGIRADPLEKELTWLAELQARDVLSLRCVQIDSFDNAFLALQNYNEASAAMFSLASQGKGISIGYLPTPDGKRFSLATGWAWAIATDDPDRGARAAGLMRWLSDPEFLAQWSRALRMLPATRTALGLWPKNALRVFAEGISEEAFAFPEDEISNSFGPVFSKAAREVLSDGVAPAVAAAEAAQVANP
jgi:ABC-type glycerol-3-phosphate transport system substrate-binding protein